MKLYSTLLIFLLSFSTSPAQVEEAVEMEAPTRPNTPPPQPANVKDAPKRAYHGKMGGRFGFYLGQDWLVPPIYDELTKDYSDFMVAKKNNKYGVIDRLNNEVLPFEYDAFRRVLLDWETKTYADYYRVEKDGLQGICDLNGVFLIPLKYTFLGHGRDGLFGFGDEKDGYGIMKLDGTIVISQSYETKIAKLKDNVYKVQKGGKIGFIDENEKVIMPYELEEMKFENGYYSIKKEGKWGMMNKDLKVVVEPKYDGLRRRFNGIIKIFLDDKIGALNSDFKEIIPPVYYRLSLFHPRYFEARKNENDRGKGVLDTLGKQVLDFYYSDLKRGGGDLIFARPDNGFLYAVFNKKGKEITPPTYIIVGGLDNDFSYVNKESKGKYAMIDAKGKLITPFIYDRIERKRDRQNKEKSIYVATREGQKGTLNTDGSENDDFKEIVNRQAERQQREKDKTANILKKLEGEWYGMTQINGKSYLSKLLLMGKGGVRSIYHLEKGKEGWVDQYFEVLLLSDASTMLLKFPNRYLEVHGNQPPTTFNEQNTAMFTQEMLNLKGGFGNVSIKKYFKKESAKGTTDDFDVLRKIVEYQPIVEDLKSKVESRPGGLRYPEFIISPATGLVQIINYSDPDDFAKVEIREDGYVFVPTRWQQDSYFSLAGVLRNIRYLDKDGTVKTGDLDICFVATKRPYYYFKPI